MIDMGTKFQSLMQNIDGQAVSARLSILNTPAITIYGFTSNSIEQYLIDNGYVTDKPNTSGQVKLIRQMNNCITNETAKYGIFEGDGIDLDGSVQLTSKVAKNNEIGWYSASLSKIDGTFDTNPQMEFGVYNNEQSALNIVFSNKRGEYATDFTITFTYEDIEIEATVINVTGNSNTIYTLQNAPVVGSGSIKIEIIKWSKTNARAKIIDIYFGDMLIYTDNEIVSVKGNKEVDLINEDVPSKQLDVTIQDVEGGYNIFNPQRRTGKFKCCKQNCT